MPRIKRIDIANEIYHVINRANTRVQIFDDDNDYKQFESILEIAKEKFDMRIYSYCIMPNHWHLILSPKVDGDLSKFMGWLTNTHTRRWHTTKKTIGNGHLYQGRYKSFLCQKNNYFLILVRYVERNAKRAKLVIKAEDWKWSSIWRRKYGTDEQKKILSSLPIETPENYLKYLNESQSDEELFLIRKSVNKNVPFGNNLWVGKMIDKFKLAQTIHGVGRPKNGG
ncbi:MAG: transposase [Candidatus Pacebacteria bacterium]|nr:transposase [Candidatus Paceibacterota bacterium]